MSLAGTPSPEAISGFAGRRIWVVGDLMLDDYLEGTVDRVSPEAPVQVVKVARSYQRLGGAGNVANACAALGAEVRLIGVLGNDEAADRFLELCAGVAIDTSAVARRTERRTIRKQRVLSRQQQILRLDWEDVDAVAPQEAWDLFVRAAQDGPPDVLILSDYAKGLFTRELLARLITWGREHRVPTLVDPKIRQVQHYAGATLLTPNLGELELATDQRLKGVGLDELTAAARQMLDLTRAEALCVTLGERGMLLLAQQGEADLIPASAREVYDVTGAGDTVVATLALALASGIPLGVAARLANSAAGLVVAKAGTAEVTAAELADHLGAPTAGKLLSRQDLANRCRRWRQQGRRIVFTNGCFDLLHAGHLKLLREAARLGDLLLVGINSDESVRRLKGESRPLVPEGERAALLGALEIVDGVVIFGEATPGDLIAEIIPHVLVKGADYQIDQVVGRQVVEDHGGRVVLVELLRDHSTTALAQKASGNSQTAGGQGPRNHE